VATTSIFKKEPGERQESNIFILAEDYGDAALECETGDAQKGVGMSVSEPLIQKYSHTAGGANGTTNDVVITIRDKRLSSQGSPKKKRFTVRNDLKSVKDGKLNLSMDEGFVVANTTSTPKSRKRVSRFFSFRNVVASINSLILILSTLLVASVTIQAGSNAIQDATNSMAGNVLQSIDNLLSNMFLAAENVNVFTEAMLIYKHLTPTDSISCTEQLYFVSRKQPLKMDRIYAFSEADLCGIENMKLPNFASAKTYRAVYINATTTPDMWAYNIPRELTCNFQANSTCDFDMSLFGNPKVKPSVLPNLLQNNEKLLNELGSNRRDDKYRVTWTTPWKPSSFANFRVSTLRPVYDRTSGDLFYVAAVDIFLSSISRALSQFTLSLVDNRDRTMSNRSFSFHVIEKGTNQLIATSDLSLYARTGVNQRIDLSQLSSLGGEGDTLHAIAEARTTFGDLSRVQATRISWIGQDIISAKGFSHSDKFRDLEWVIVGHFPARYFLNSVQEAYYILVPSIACAILFGSIVSSVLITRAIGRPLKETAKQIMRISDLDLDAIYGKDVGTDSSGSKDGTCLCGLIPAVRCGDLKELKYIRKAMHSLHSSLRSFIKYVPMEIVSLIIKMNREAVLGADESEISIFFSDIADFTTISEQLQPKQLVELMRFSHL
jgi:hypothetical protein